MPYSRAVLFAIGLCAFLAACGGSGSTATPSAGAASTTLAISWWQPLSPSVGTPSAIELYQQQFLDFSHSDTTVSVAATTTSWSASSDSVALSTPTPGVLGGAGGIYVAPSPAAGQTRVIYQHPGMAMLSAMTPAGPVTISVLTYASVDFGCDFRASGAFPAPDPALGNAAFATAAGTPNAPCAGSITPVQTPVTFNFPYGATLVTDGAAAAEALPSGAQTGPEFRLIPASLWRNDFTSIDNATLATALSPCSITTSCPVQSARVILFKTATGAVVKMDALESINGGVALIGFYESTDASGQFPY